MSLLHSPKEKKIIIISLFEILPDDTDILIIKICSYFPTAGKVKEDMFHEQYIDLPKSMKLKVTVNVRFRT